MVPICPHGPSQGGTWLFFCPFELSGTKGKPQGSVFYGFPGRMSWKNDDKFQCISGLKNVAFEEGSSHVMSTVM
jgi:hypothetical protein